MAIVSELFCVSDDVLYLGNILVEWFDGEGIFIWRVDIIKNGVLIGLLYSVGIVKWFDI